MGLTEEDYETLRNEADAEPERYTSWDPHRQFRTQYENLHSAQTIPVGDGVADKLERAPTQEGGVLSAVSSSSSNGVQYAGIRARPGAGQRPSSYATQADEFEEDDITHGGHSNIVHRSTTHRLNSRLERHPTALERISTHRSQHAGTVGSTRIRTKRPGQDDEELPKFGGGKPYPPELPKQEEYVVEFDGHDDPLHAQNWATNKKLWISAIVMFNSLTATFGSSIFSNAAVGVEAEFDVGSEVGTLGTSLFVLGYAFGPIIWAPFSELYGRRLPVVISAFGYGIFSIGVATAANLQTVLICRFFAGLFGSCPLAVVAAIFADMYNNEVRGLAISAFSATVFMGPLLSPFVGGFITQSYLGWRWTMYISAIMGFTSFILDVLFLPETYAPIILVDKAAELRRKTQNWGIHAKQEEIEVDFKELIVKNTTRPLKILFTEPIVLFITIYMSFIYGLLYLFLTAYALVFQGVYGMNQGVGGLPYFGMVLGELIAFGVVVAMNPSYVRKLKANNNIPVPEWRLPIVMIAGPIFAAGLFWFGWTGYTDSIPWIVPTLSGLFTGFGIFSIFLQLLNYIIDAYLMFAASAIAGNTFMRSLFGAVFPLFARYMYDGIGINYGNTLIGAVAAVMVPLPFFFYYFGKKIRAKSKMAPAPDIEQDKRRAREGKKDEESKGVPEAAGDRSASTGEETAVGDMEGEKEKVTANGS